MAFTTSEILILLAYSSKNTYPGRHTEIFLCRKPVAPFGETSLPCVLQLSCLSCIPQACPRSLRGTAGSMAGGNTLWDEQGQKMLL